MPFALTPVLAAAEESNLPTIFQVSFFLRPDLLRKFATFLFVVAFVSLVLRKHTCSHYRLNTRPAVYGFILYLFYLIVSKIVYNRKMLTINGRQFLQTGDAARSWFSSRQKTLPISRGCQPYTFVFVYAKP